MAGRTALDRSRCSGETGAALNTGSQPPRKSPIFTWVRIIGYVAAIAYGVAAVYLSVVPNTSARNDADCADRVRLLRDRVLTVIERSQPTPSPQNDPVLNLIRETQATCAASQSERLRELEKLWLRQRGLWEGEAEVRRELLAL